MPETTSPAPPASPPNPPRKRQKQARPLPFGPFGMLIVTAIALTAAFGAARVMIAVLHDDDAVDVQDALNGSVAAPLVLDAKTRATIGSHAPDVRLEYLDGGTQQLAEVAGIGTPVVVNFWSSTCIPCLNEMPALEEVNQRFGDDLTIVGIDVTDTVEDGVAMVDKTGVTYRNARDPRGEIFAVYGGIALPRTVLIDGDGVVVDTHSGELDAQELTELLREHGLVES